jgi:predicted Fe-Mo cluster-binding NifX family protein
MNLLIPTEDGISISPDFERAHNFRVISVVNGSVNKDEIRVIKESFEKEFHSWFGSNAGINSEKAIANLSGINLLITETRCVVLANSISEKSEKWLTDNNFVLLLTMETNIINAIIYFIKHHTIPESDYCCCP